MIDRIYSFGDSFLFGSELSDCDGTGHDPSKASSLTWPALIAKELNLDYECHAVGAIGNSRIALQIIKHATPQSLAVINWSWMDRFDYFDTEGVIDNFTLSPHNGDDVSEFYYRNIHTELGAKYFSLIHIFSAHSYLKDKNIPFISTIMDKCVLDSSWAELPFIKNLQEQLADDFSTFPNGQTFLEWSRANGYPEGQGWHPLEEAHEEADNYWLPIYEKAINTHITTK